jgi:hypothetical protein
VGEPGSGSADTHMETHGPAQVGRVMQPPTQIGHITLKNTLG